VRGLPFSVEEAVFKKDFEECGPTTRCSLPKDWEGNFKGVAFVEYTTEEGLKKALEFNGTDYGGRTIYVEKLADRDAGKGKDGKGKGKDGKGKGKGNEELTAFIRGLPFSTDEATFNKDFGECGEVVKCVLPKNEEGQVKGIAFVEFANEEGLTKALAYNETDYGGRTIFVVKASDREPPKGKDGKDKGKGKGKDGKDGKGKKGKKGKDAGMSFAKKDGAMVESTGVKVAFADSDEEDAPPKKKAKKVVEESDSE